MTAVQLKRLLPQLRRGFVVLGHGVHSFFFSPVVNFLRPDLHDHPHVAGPAEGE
ncbi:hypothetical protein LUW74_07765 [Actinomadura madurae]|uniref:hypothetical protein n=1 Tax=Actinomadura madurae TaxID=1993 RepID=UPI00202687E3|nr:hypothetical protein [Actinomadura madurae]URN03254.1 hypothetical protein LUW74_07765 [Actinomadura madurae]